MKNIKRLLLILTAGAVMLSLCGCGDSSSSGSSGDSSDDSPKNIGIHHAVITVKDYGEIKVELDGDTAPISVDNFMKLAKDGYYDGVTFHRIIEGFMIQGGNGAETATIKGEFSSNGVKNNILHKRGVISMARVNGLNDSASSQFFIMHADSASLDGDYAAFGHVTDGMDVVDAIAKDAKPTDGNGGIAPDEQPVITSVVITD